MSKKISNTFLLTLAIILIMQSCFISQNIFAEDVVGGTPQSFPIDIDTSSCTIFTDDCSTLDNIYEKSSNIKVLDDEIAIRCRNDESRISAQVYSNPVPERYIVYHSAEAINSFAMWTYFSGSAWADTCGFKIYTSQDNKTYNLLTCNISDSAKIALPDGYGYSETWYERLYYSINLPDNVNYIKIKWAQVDDRSWEGHLGKVQLISGLGTGAIVGGAPQKSPITSALGEIYTDECSTLNNLFEKSSNLQLVTNEAERYRNDATRIRAQASNPVPERYIVYKTNGGDITAFAMWAYFSGSAWADTCAFKVYTSEDNETYNLLSLTTSDNEKTTLSSGTSTWHERLYYSTSLPDKVNYIKIEWAQIDDRSWEGLLGKVEFATEISTEQFLETEVSFSANSESITTLNDLSAGTEISCNINMTSDRIVTYNGKGFLALYYNGILKDISLENIGIDSALTGGGTIKITLPSDFSVADNADTWKVRLFLLNESLTPLTDDTYELVSGIRNEYSLATEQYVRMLGRGFASNESRTFNWPGSGFEFSFDGSDAQIYVSKMNGEAYFNVSVNGLDPERISLQEGWNTIVSGLKRGENHTIRVSRSSEAVYGKVSMSTLRANNINAPVPTTPKARKIEFYGDSYTVGYGNLGSDAKNTDNWQAYPAITARNLNADYNILAFSGKGAAINYSSPDATVASLSGNMHEQFALSDVLLGGETPSENWNFDLYTPQVVVVFLGTNDYNGRLAYETETGESATEYFIDGYTSFINDIRLKYPQAEIVLCSKSANCFVDEITSICETLSANDTKIHRVILENFSGTGVSNHPTLKEHKIIAEELTEKIKHLFAD